MAFHVLMLRVCLVGDSPHIQHLHLGIVTTKLILFCCNRSLGGSPSSTQFFMRVLMLLTLLDYKFCVWIIIHVLFISLIIILTLLHLEVLVSTPTFNVSHKCGLSSYCRNICQHPLTILIVSQFQQGSQVLTQRMPHTPMLSFAYSGLPSSWLGHQTVLHMHSGLSQQQVSNGQMQTSIYESPLLS